LQKAERLKHLKEKPNHKIPYHGLSFFVENGPAADTMDAPQPYDEDDGDYCYFCPLPSNGAPVEWN
jgi:hypothetical protein